MKMKFMQIIRCFCKKGHKSIVKEKLLLDMRNEIVFKLISKYSYSPSEALSIANQAMFHRVLFETSFSLKDNLDLSSM